MKTRCAWARTELGIIYHDEEWGVPSRDDRHLFELLILEGAQAGLSWETILKKREHYREVFDDFDMARIARYSPRKIEALLNDPGIVRNRLKVQSAVLNAQAALAARQEFGSLAAFLWSFVDNKPIDGRRSAMSDVPPRTETSDAMSKALLKRGFKFVGSTICYAFMQAVGMANDHTMDCFRYKPVSRIRS